MDKIFYEQDGIIVYEKSPGVLYWRGENDLYRRISFQPGDKDSAELHLQSLLRSIRKALCKTTLHDLAIKYQSDKAEHGYCPFYEQHLPKNPKKLLEIGVLKGASIRMWKEYFPDCEIHGLDLFIENDIPNIEGVVWHKGNQLDWQLLELLRNESFDVIIDDGSHNARDQMITFFGLYNGNPYFIEDLQCNDEEYFSQGIPVEMRAKHLFGRIPFDGIITDCQLPIILIQSV